MSSVPSVAESAIRQRADAKVLARGREYYDGGYVTNVVWRDGELLAEVAGSEYEPYQVQVLFDGQTILTTNCTCPYDWGGDCKHIAATLFYLIHRRDAVEERPAIRDLVQGQDRERLATLVIELAGRHPGLADDIERFLSSVPATTGIASATAPASTVDVDLLRRQILADLRGSIQTGYDSWGEERWYDSDLGAALGPAETRVRALLDADDARGALVVLDAVTRAWDDGVNELDEYVLEYFYDIAGDVTLDLGELWVEAILTADLSQEERDQWVDTMQEMTGFFGGESLEMAMTAAEQGWDYPPLVAAMQGNITEKGAWEDESPWYSDSLAEVRLRILERRGQFQEYLNLAQAEGQFMSYLHMLVKTGQNDVAIAEAKQFLDKPSQFHALAQTLLDQGEAAQAFDLAQHGLALKASRDDVEHGLMPDVASSKASLAVWLRDAAWAQRQPELALDAAQSALAEDTTLTNYAAVEKIAGDEWAAIKPAMLQLAAESSDADGKVEIYLHEQMYAEAIKTVDGARWFYDIDKVLEAVKTEHPDWAFAQCCQRAESIMDAGRAKDYNVAAEWLRRGRDILLAADKREKWTRYLNGVMDLHQRKYKLMPMLRALK